MRSRSPALSLGLILARSRLATLNLISEVRVTSEDRVPDKWPGVAHLAAPLTGRDQASCVRDRRPVMPAANKTYGAIEHARAKCAPIIRRLQLLAPNSPLQSLQQPVADAPDVDDVAVAFLDAQLLPESGGVRFQGASPSQRAESPDLTKELLLREDAIGLDGEACKELELLRRENHERVAHRDPPRPLVDNEIAGDQHVGGGSGASPQESADAREELLVRERPAHDVVGSSIESANAFDGIRRGCEENHGDISIPGPPRLPAPKSEAEIELREQDDVGSCSFGKLERFAPPRCAEDVEAVVAELPSQVLARLELGLGDKDSAWHDADASPNGAAAPDVLSGESVTTVPQSAELNVAVLNGALVGGRL